MAFSYSDKNFTVVGNLCFVHILLDGTKKFFDIPPAIADRILISNISYFYPYSSENKVRGVVAGPPNIGLAVILPNKIFLSEAGIGYLNFCLPIDSNK